MLWEKVLTMWSRESRFEIPLLNKSSPVRTVTSWNSIRAHRSCSKDRQGLSQHRHKQNQDVTLTPVLDPKNCALAPHGCAAAAAVGAVDGRIGGRRIQRAAPATDALSRRAAEAPARVAVLPWQQRQRGHRRADFAAHGCSAQLRHAHCAPTAANVLSW